MAEPSLASLLGLAPAPVIAPGAVERRLSAAERRVATAAFHRARGYGERVDFPRFRDTVLHEAFGAMPLYAMQRLFAVWNFAGGAISALSLKEFLVGVAIAWRGSRDEHLRFAFQLMDRYGAQELAKRDAVAFLRVVAAGDGVVAVEEATKRRCTVEEFAAMLFPTDAAVLTPAKFMKTMASRSFSSLALIDWIPRLADQFERELQKTTAAVSPVGNPSTSGGENESDSLMDTIMAKLRRFNSEESAASTASTASPPTLEQRPVSLQIENNYNIIHIEPVSADQFQKLKAVVASLVELALETNEQVHDEDIRDRLQGFVSGIVLQAALETARVCDGDFLLSAVKSTVSSKGEVARTSPKAKLLWWVLCICCSCARSSPEVLRYLFVLFDVESRGYWALDQLATFIRCADISNEEQSSREEAEFLAQTVLDDIGSQNRSLLREAVADDDPLIGVATQFHFRDFERYTARHPIPGCGSAEIEIVFTLFHAELTRLRGQRHSHRSYLRALQGFCDQLIAYEVASDFGFALIRRTGWDHLVDWVCDYDTELPLLPMLKNQVCTVVDPITIDSNSALTEQPVASTGDNEDSITAVPIALWLVLALKLGERHTQETGYFQSWAAKVTQLDASVTGGRQIAGVDHDSWSFRAKLVSIQLVIVARDSSECLISIPYCVVGDDITLHSLVQVVLALHDQGRGKNTAPSMILARAIGSFFCEGEVIFTNQDGERCQIQVSAGSLLIALGTLDEGSSAVRASVTLNVLLTDERSNSYIPRWTTPMLSSPASSQRSGASTPSRTPKHSKRGAAGGWTKVHGLANLGNTCFMNSALQCLAATPLLREYFLKGEHLYDLSSHAIKPVTGPPFRSGKRLSPKSSKLQLPQSSLLPITFGQLLAEMNAFSSNGSVSGMADVISPKYMRTAIAQLFPHLSDGTQQDAQEFLTSLLSCLSDELKRLPIDGKGNGVEPTAQLSPSLFSRFASLSRQRNDNSPPVSLQPDSSKALLSKLRFQVNDSNGRPDTVVAKEWWISHLIAEPSLITALFCGQFKSSLRCTRCGSTSTRFEPFSSLQLPLLDETAMISPRKKLQNQQVVIVLHFLDSPCRRPSLRLVTQAGLDWTMEQLLIKLQQDHATYSDAGNRRDHIAVTMSGFVVDDYIDPDALVSSIPTPIDVFEIDFGDQARSFGDAHCMEEPLEPGKRVLARASHNRWVRAVVERQGLPPPQGSSGSQSPVQHQRDTFHVRIEEAGLGASVCIDRAYICTFTNDRYLLARFVHRRTVLVPFYSTSPYRHVLCGFPFVCRLSPSHNTGRALYHLIHRRFMPNESLPYELQHRRSFVLKRVRTDGKNCSLCHWTEHCDGCKIDRLDEEPLDLEMDETIAIDWLLDTHEPVEEWLANGCSIEDHSSYTSYRRNNTHTIEKSLENLCSEEHVEARCSRCANEAMGDSEGPADKSTNPASSAGFIPHTKTLALWTLPPILVIHLKRFELVAEGGFSWQRLNHSVDFQVDNFDMARFLDLSEPPKVDDELNEREEVTRAESFLKSELHFPTATASRDTTWYRLYGIVNHMGNLGGGHYTAHIRHPDNGDWWLVDDASATPANAQTLSPSSSAYLLFYVRHDVDPISDDEDNDEMLSSRPRNLSEFYPRQENATPVADAAVRALCKQDIWSRISSAKQDGKRDDGNCAVM